MTILVKRLLKDSTELNTLDKKLGIVCSCNNNNKNNNNIWNAIIHGPQNTPYQNGIFKLEIKFPNNYPFVPPKIKFVTQIYHPNINSNGIICLDVLDDNWTPTLYITDLLKIIRSLLINPNPKDPLMPDIAKQYLLNNEIFIKTAVDYTKQFANKD